MQRYAEVIVDIAHSNIDRIFDYIIPEGLEAKPGAMVRVPFAGRIVEGFVTGVKDATDVPENRLKSLQCILDAQAVNDDLIELAYGMKDRYKCLMVDALRVMIPAELRGARVGEKAQTYIACSGAVDTGKARDMLSRAAKQLEIYEYVSARPQATRRAELTDLFGNCSAQVRSLIDKGLLCETRQRQFRQPSSTAGIEATGDFRPNAHQQKAIDEISRAIDNGTGQFLLHGVTGSGKTEVYMQCARKALERGRTVIILVPEISLTPQMARRFTSRFGRLSAVLHSRLSAGERFDEWQRIKNGEAKIVIGARSAVFAPARDIGLIVVDEEHESTYRSESSPRYDAVEIAELRCRRHGAPLVLGSATPSVNTYYKAAKNTIELIRMPLRIGEATMPDAVIVDMREELRAGNKRTISQKLYHDLAGTVERGEQAILFLNRRGHSTFVSCRNCGYVARCELCELPLTYHSAGAKLRCHYCLSEQEVPVTCPTCGSSHIRYFGGGTQRIENDLKELFPGLRCLRMDADTTKGKDSHLRILDAFEKKHADVLIGTQMITKGLDYPNVTLVGVAAADSSLYINDFRSAERTFQLISQVAGRAGRDVRRGTVVIQTYTPDHYSVLRASEHDYEGFFRQEIEMRKAGLFPPFSRFARWLYCHEDEATARLDALHALGNMKDFLETNRLYVQSVLMLDATQAPIAKINGRYRWQVILKFYPDVFGGKIIDGFFRCGGECPNGSHKVLEIDPGAML